MSRIRHWSARFRLWWRAPVTSKDRWAGAIIAAFAGFWIGVLLLVALGAFSSASTISAWWALSFVAPVAVLGYAFPKFATVFLLPFASINGGV